MSGFWHSLGFGGPAGRPTHDGHNVGKFRAGRRSRELQKEARLAKTKQLAPGKGAAVKALPGVQPGQFKAQLAPAAPPSAAPLSPARFVNQLAPTGRSIVPVTPAPRGKAPAGKATPAPVGAPRRVMGLHGLRAELLGDAGGAVSGGSVNGEVWVSTQLVPLVVWDGQQYTQLVYPDGTKAMAKYWLPKMDMSGSFDPAAYGQAVGYQFYSSGPYAMSNDGWGQGWIPPGTNVTHDGQSVFVTDTWAFMPRNDCNLTAEVNYPGIEIGRADFAVPFSSQCRSFSDITGHEVIVYGFKASFDWSKYSPSQQSYIWTFLSLAIPFATVWKSQPAELWRVDMQSIAGNGALDLPGHAWLDLNFLDALYSDDPAVKHGLPRMLRDDGTLDIAKVNDWGANNGWANALGLTQNAMLATIQDVPEPKAGVVPATPADTSSGGGNDGDPDTLALFNQAQDDQKKAFQNMYGGGVADPNAPPSDVPIVPVTPYDPNYGYPGAGDYANDGNYNPPPIPYNDDQSWRDDEYNAYSRPRPSDGGGDAFDDPFAVLRGTPDDDPRLDPLSPQWDPNFYQAAYDALMNPLPVIGVTPVQTSAQDDTDYGDGPLDPADVLELVRSRGA